VYDRSESSSKYDMDIGQERDILGELGIIMSFNDQTVTWDTAGYCHYSNEGQRYSTLSSAKALIEVYLSAN
jgi:hypothetical protein